MIGSIRIQTSSDDQPAIIIDMAELHFGGVGYGVHFSLEEGRDMINRISTELMRYATGESNE